jgi:hypothetical protein
MKCIVVALIFLWVHMSLLAQQAVESSQYHYPIVLITNTSDFQWKMIDTVRAMYVEPTHTTVLEINHNANRYYPPFVVTKIGEASDENN